MISATIKSILDRKGRDVITTGEDATVGHVVTLLSRHNIGVVVVVDSAGAIVGIVSERDVVRSIAADGTACLGRPVTDLMSAPVVTCAAEDTLHDVLMVMNERRIRHLPVMSGAASHGIISMRDVVESYVNDLEVTADALAEYVTGSAY